MNSLGQWSSVLLNAQNTFFLEERAKAETYYTKYTKKGDTKEADYRSFTAAKFGLMAFTPQGGEAHLDQYTPGTQAIVAFKKLTIATVWPEELVDDMKSNSRTKDDKVNLFTKTASADFADAEIRTYEYITADLVVRASSTTTTNTWFGTVRDGLALASTSHVSLRGNVTYTTLQTASAMTQLALLEGAKILVSHPNPAGFPQGNVGKIGIIYGRYNMFRVDELLGAKTTPDVALTANPNPLNNEVEGLAGWQKIYCPYLPDTFTGWALIDMANHKLLRFPKQEGRINSDVEARTGNLIQRCVSRYAIYADSATGYVLQPGI